MFDIWSNTLCKLLLAIILNNAVDNVLSNECMVNFHKFIEENLLHYCLVHVGWSKGAVESFFFFFNTISFFWLSPYKKVKKKKRTTTTTQATYINILFVLFSVIVFLDSDDRDRQIKLKLTF